MRQSTSTTAAPWERTASPNSLRPTFTTATWRGSSTTEPLSWSVNVGVLWGGRNGRARAHRPLGGRLPNADRGARAGDPRPRAPRIPGREHGADVDRTVAR